MGSLAHRFFSALLIFTVFSMTTDCCEFSNLSEGLDTLNEMSYSVDASDESQASFEQASLSAKKNTSTDTDCQGADGCVQCRTGCCHLLIPTLKNIVSNSITSDSFEEIPSAIYLSRILSGPKEPPRA